MRVSDTAGGPVLYKAENAWIEQVKSNRQKLGSLCSQHLNRPVRVQTIDGHAYEGTLVGSDGCHIHLMVRPSGNDQRFFGPYAYNSIITLVLYELLVITLLLI